MILSAAQTIQHKTTGRLMNNELERIRKAVIKAYFMVIFKHLCGGNERNNKKPQLVVSAARLQAKDLTPAPQK
jgi:hypothetical protein